MKIILTIDEFDKEFNDKIKKEIDKKVDELSCDYACIRELEWVETKPKRINDKQPRKQVH